MKKIIKQYGKTKRTFIRKNCEECFNKFEVLESEIKRGSGRFCSRLCYYKDLKKNRPKDKNSWAWKGDKVGKTALHNWVQKNLGKPEKCEKCGNTKAKKYEWANKSQEYKRELDDWLRLCTKCHWEFDYKFRIKKWKRSVKKLGWKVK